MSFNFRHALGAIVVLPLLAAATALQAQDKNETSCEFHERFQKSQREEERIEAMFDEGKGADALPELLQLLKSKRPFDQRKALEWLTRLASESTPALPSIDGMLAEDEPDDYLEMFALLKAMG